MRKPSITEHNLSVINNFKLLLSGDYLSSKSRTYSERSAFLLGANHMAIRMLKLDSSLDFDDQLNSFAGSELDRIFCDYLKSIPFEDYVQNPYDAELRDCKNVILSGGLK